VHSNWRAVESLPEYLSRNGVVAIADIDTRRLTRILREKGAQGGAILSGKNVSQAAAVERARSFPGMKGMDLAREVTTENTYEWRDGSWDLDTCSWLSADPQRHVVAYDFGIKRNILRMLADRGCRVTVVPATTSAGDVLALQPDGIFLSNGPGDPEPCDYAIAAIREFLAQRIPLFGICLGHQLLGLAAGAATVKMKFGHHGANHPVQDLDTGQVMITSQNHGFAVDEESLPGKVKATHRSLFDDSLQGIDIKSILIIGAGPIVIGQACEFDYSGAQACKALREEGYRVVLVNSNPATIMTDPETADAIYIEPIEWRIVEQIIAIERPDVLLPTMGGQTALNCALDLAREGVLEKYEVEMIGASREAIDMAEDREQFRNAMLDIGLEVPAAAIAHSMEEALQQQPAIGYPTIIRPSFTMGGSGGGIAYNREEFEAIVSRGLELSPTTEVLLEESVLGWKEFEMEVVRDNRDNCIIICSIENFDAMGVHTGDSITVAPAQTLTDKEYQRLRDASIAVLRKIGVDTGGSNVQFGINPQDGRVVIIEMNPRVSRSSALASKATGFPIAKVAAKLAVGYTLDELRNEITGGATPASFEPAIDYVVTKIPRFAFEKFPAADATLTTQMKSVGEAMSIGRTFQESLQKALRSLETGRDGLNEILQGDEPEVRQANLRRELREAGAERILYVADGFREKLGCDTLQELTGIDPWFLAQIEDIVHSEEAIRGCALESLQKEQLFQLKRKGFSDSRIAELLGEAESRVRAFRHKLGIRPVYKRVDTCAAEFSTSTAYMYSTYEEECESEPTDRKKIMVLGGGPNRIGQGIEFDYCCVHAALALRDDGFETIMVNCNPETVSTDYDTSDRLYFEPLTLEDVLEIVSKENPHGVIVQFGGQTPLNLARALEAEGVPIIGTSPDSIDLAEDRERFQHLLERLDLKQPPNRTAMSAE
jgi:carbamoyl-phosphate synthase large subunit